MEEQVSHKELIKVIRERIAFLITVAILFSVVVGDFFVAMGESEVISKGRALAWLLGVGFSVLSYLLVGFGNELGRKMLVLIKMSVMINIALLAMMLVVMTTIQYVTFPDYFVWIFIVSTWGSLFIPIVTFSFLFCAFCRAAFLSLRFKRKKI